MLRRLLVLVVAIFATIVSTANAKSDDSTNKRELKYVFPFSKIPVTYSRDHIDYPATDVHGCYAHVLAPTSGVIFDVEKKISGMKKSMLLALVAGSQSRFTEMTESDTFFLTWVGSK